MAGYLQERPGWYRDPDEPRRLRYWDGKAWTGRSRKRPPWALHTEAFEVTREEADRSVEGPVHPRELREPVATGAWSRDWLSWRGRPPLTAWHRGASASGGGSPYGNHTPPSVKLRPARRPLLAMVCLVVVAVAVVVSSVAVISPYESRQLGAQVAESRFAVQASKDCSATLPKYRKVLASSTSGPSISGAAHEVDLLRERLASIPPATLVSATVVEWLQTWRQFTAAQRLYASLLGEAAASRSSAGAVTGDRASQGSPPASQQQSGALAAYQAREEAHKWAVLADRLSANLELPACRLEPAQAS